MHDSPIPVVLLVSGDAIAYSGVRDRLAKRGWDAEIVSAGARRSSIAGPFADRWRPILAGRRIARERGEARPALIHAVGRDAADLAIELATRWKRPYLLAIDEFPRPGERIRLSRRWCRGVTATGRDLADELIRELGLPMRLVTVVPPGVPPAAMRPAAPEGSWIPVVGTAVGSGVGSGLPTFLDAARIVLASGVEAEFVLAELGSGSTLARRLAGGLAMAERLTIIEGIDLGRSFWPVLDLYAHPSRAPSSGRPLLTAMSHGIPAIASEVPGLREIADGGRSARIAPPGDAQALAAAILDLLADREAAARLGRRGRSHVAAAYSADREADALAALYRAAIDSSEGLGVRHRCDAARSSVASRRS